MNNLIHSPTGAFHVITALMALLSGTLILLIRKGTRNHKRWGYIFISSMLMVNGSAFFLYGLFGTFGPFHGAAVFSMASIIIGIHPLFNRRNPRWLRRHLYGLYFSIFGLYAAFVSEILTRIIHGHFFLLIGLASVSVVSIGGVIITNKSEEWIRSLGRTGKSIR